MSDSKLLDPQLLARLKDYQLLARIAANGFLSGAHRSVSSGQGTEFLQYREYVKGEDLKFVDWKLYAKSNRLQTKRFAEQTQAACYLVLDTSASMAYQGDRSYCHKLHYACMLAATLAYLALHQGDKIGLLAYSDEIHEWLPPSSHSGQLNLVLQALARIKPQGKALHRSALETLISKLSDRGMVVLLSDMIEAETELPELFKFSTTKTHEGLAIQILDQDELDFPFSTSTLFEDSETALQVRTNPAAIRSDYLKRVEKIQNRLQADFSQSQVDFLTTTTDMDLALSLSRYFQQRKSVR